VDLWAQKDSLKIVGYYHANQNIHDEKLSPISIKIANKIKHNFGDSIILLMDNKNIGKKGFTANLYHSIQNEKNIDWIEKEQKSFEFLNHEEETDKVFSDMQILIKRNIFNHLVDFDDHLLNSSLDWRNGTLFKNK
jgi:hypothetical protein